MVTNSEGISEQSLGSWPATPLGLLRASLVRASGSLEEGRLRLMSQPWFTSRLLPAMPRSLRWLGRRLYLAPVDLADRLLGRRDGALPPKAATFTGAVEDFAATGETLVGALVSTAGLERSSRVLDVGCGLGRLAAPLSRYLDAEGCYHGLDVVERAIAWCRDHITSPHGNVNFIHADVANREYNPGGGQSATAYRFPFDDASFDLVVLVSVFTHLLPDDIDHYLAEISRVLKKGGRCFATMFLMDDEKVRLMALPGTSLRFSHHPGPHWLQSKKVPELAVGYDEPFVRQCYDRHGFDAGLEVYRGCWAGGAGSWPRGSGLEQDVIVGTKR
jgi:ubiquinone/menaquinone biosynthesis C-methylase UbiE